MEPYKKANQQELEVCVLIPSYNNLEGLVKSLASITYQQDQLCVVVVDDGSVQHVLPEVVTPHLKHPFLLQVVRLEKNAGITHALNEGLDWIQQHLNVRYIARLDCGDTCHPDRFFKQVAFLDQHPQVGLLGTWCTFQDPTTGLSYSYTTPTSHTAIMTDMHSRNVFIHPTVMFRSELVTAAGGYPVNYPFVEDYALFYKLLHFKEGAILDQFLVTCEINTGGISIRNRAAQLKGRYRVVTDFGTNPWLKVKGLMKLSLLQVLPYNIVLLLKSRRGLASQLPSGKG